MAKNTICLWYDKDAEALRIRQRAGAPPALGMLLVRDPGMANLRHEVLVDDDDHARCLPLSRISMRRSDLVNRRISARRPPR